MSRALAQGRVVLLVLLTGLLMVAAMAAVGSPAPDRQHPAIQSDTDPNATSAGERMHRTAPSISSHTADARWNMARANAANTNYINTTGPTNPITKRWTIALEADDLTAGPVVVNGTVYFGTRYIGSEEGESNKRGRLYAVDAWTGETRWTFQPPAGFHLGHIAVLRNTVYVGANHGNVYALDAATGDRYWRFVTEGSPRDLKVANRTLYVASGTRFNSGHVYALGALRGEERWRFTTNEGPPVGLAVKDGAVFVSTRVGNVTALDAETAAVNWHADLNESLGWEHPLTSPVVANGNVYVGSKLLRAYPVNYGRLYALDSETSEEHWKRSKRDADIFPPSVLRNTVYFSADYLHAVDAQTGTDRWTARSLKETPVLGNDIGYVRTDQTLYTLDPATGSQHARWTPTQMNNSWDRFRGMAVLNGSLYTGVKYDVPGNSYRSDYTEMYALGTPEFTYTNLSVRPRDPELNESVTAAVTVRNTGTGPGTFNATLVVNGNVTNTTTTRLAPRTSQTVTFTRRYPQNGTYTVEIGGLSRTITVGDVASAVTSTPTPTTVGDADTPTETGPSGETATSTGSGDRPAAMSTPTSGTAPGFGVAGWLVAVALVAVLVGIQKRE